MRIKLDKESKNEYIFSGGVWVRNFTKYNTKFLSLNNMVDNRDYELFLRNEIDNRSNNFSRIEEENFFFPKVVILSDGFDFENRHQILRQLPSDVAIFAVNGALAKWGLLNAPQKFINFFIVNNPYDECLKYLPRKHRYFPSCISSLRTNFDFVQRYKGRIFTYEPTRERKFGKPTNAKYYIDDYRNPICAAIGLAHQFGVQKLMLFCCDDSFKDERASAIKLENGLWCYPQQMKSQQIIDANLFWLKQQEDLEISISDYSSGSNYNYASYINNEEDVLKFFIDI